MLGGSVREAFWLSENWRRTHLRYYPFYGRGYVQLTWQKNYRRESQSDRTGIDLVTNPDVAMQPDIAAQVLFVGMEHGDFGG
jgi:predicted chitinase